MDTHGEVHVAAVVSPLGKVLVPSPFRPWRPAIVGCSSGPASWGRCAGPVWKAPALRRGPVPLPAGSARPGIRSESARPLSPSPAREVGPARCAGCRASRAHAPQLLTPVGIGPDSAATLLTTMGDNPERLNTEASFAALCAASPIGYSLGRRTSRRLNHGGDRHERRTQEGKTRREIIRCLKR
ncbi:transposase [Streptomyces sp. NPDC007264]|uniref:transposase n=1 Tax=Streptomyces sp. NPDC007264 TaxID=3364777 RepID=UPI0036DE624A